MTEFETLKELSIGYSKQSKISNQFWVALIITSIISITSQPDDKNLVSLPFTLRKVDIGDFNIIILIFICVLLIAYTSAMIQTIRTRKLIQILIDNSTAKVLHTIYIHDILDSMLTPTFNRVAPISQFLLGKNQFFGNEKPKDFLQIISIVLYIFLKCTSYIFIYFIPLIALYISWQNLSINHPSVLKIKPEFIIPLIIITLIAIAILIIADIKYLLRVTKKLLNQ